jgi:cystathionine gamma-synthase
MADETPVAETHDAAQRQLKGFGTIFSFDVRGDVPAADAVCNGLQLIQHANSLGAVESTIERRPAFPGRSNCLRRCCG